MIHCRNRSKSFKRARVLDSISLDIEMDRGKLVDDVSMSGRHLCRLVSRRVNAALAMTLATSACMNS